MENGNTHSREKKQYLGLARQRQSSEHQHVTKLRAFEKADKMLNLHQNRAAMKYSSQGKQLTLDILTSSLEKSLDRENRWYKTGDTYLHIVKLKILHQWMNL